MEEQTKQIKRLADNKAAEIEDIGRGNRSEATETGHDQRPPAQYGQNCQVSQGQGQGQGYPGDPRDQVPRDPRDQVPRVT